MTPRTLHKSRRVNRTPLQSESQALAGGKTTVVGGSLPERDRNRRRPAQRLSREDATRHKASRHDAGEGTGGRLPEEASSNDLQVLAGDPRAASVGVRPSAKARRTLAPSIGIFGLASVMPALSVETAVLPWCLRCSCSSGTPHLAFLPDSACYEAERAVAGLARTREYPKRIERK